jgi:CrcB protein
MNGVTLSAWVAVGGALGSVARFWLALGVAALTGPRYPWGTLLINVLGSFVIGLFGALPAGGRLALSPEVRIFVMVGLCGGFTTFSSFSLQTLDLLRSGASVAAMLYAIGSVMLCLAGVAAGFALGRA